jgi:hypothetical protein
MLAIFCTQVMFEEQVLLRNAFLGDNTKWVIRFYRRFRLQINSLLCLSSCCSCIFLLCLFFNNYLSWNVMTSLREAQLITITFPEWYSLRVLKKAAEVLYSSHLQIFYFGVNCAWRKANWDALLNFLFSLYTFREIQHNGLLRYNGISN